MRECLKLDPDHKQCYSHYKQVKKLNKQIQSAEELIQEQRCVIVVLRQLQLLFFYIRCSTTASICSTPTGPASCCLYCRYEEAVSKYEAVMKTEPNVNHFSLLAKERICHVLTQVGALATETSQ